MLEPSGLLLDLFDKFGNCSQSCCWGTSSDCECPWLGGSVCDRKVGVRSLPLYPQAFSSLQRLIGGCCQWWTLLCALLFALQRGCCSCTEDCVWLCAHIHYQIIRVLLWLFLSVLTCSSRYIRVPLALWRAARKTPHNNCSKMSLLTGVLFLL